MRIFNGTILFVIFLYSGCSSHSEAPQELTLATTTSTRDSGLLDELLPYFEEQTGINVKVVAVGSGQALELGRRGDADVLLTHAPDAEERFMKQGHGVERHSIMHNDFVLVGPKYDPAQLQDQNSISKAFEQIANCEASFVSRGDSSGTHMKEQKIWQEAGIQPAGDWYIEGGSGMAETLRMASEKRAYTLADRGTFLAQRKDLGLSILSGGDPLLQNPYSVIVVSADKHPAVNSEAAKRFAEFLLSPEVQQRIRLFGVNRFQQPLFFPEATTTR